jgi:hypothetical protein
MWSGNESRAQSEGAAVGANPLAGKDYTLSPLYNWAIGYYVMNFQSTTGNDPVLRQLYFRHATAYLLCIGRRGSGLPVDADLGTKAVALLGSTDDMVAIFRPPPRPEAIAGLEQPRPPWAMT